MSNITNAQILDQLWEVFQERGGDIEGLCNHVDLSSLHESELIDILQKLIEGLNENI